MTTKKTVTFSLAALMGGLFPAMVAEAADTHDYSTYYTLNADYSAHGVLPPAAQWTPPSGKESAAMTDGEYYLVPSGLRLIARGDKTKHYDDPWPGEELAIQGTLLNYVTNNRKYSPTMPHLALLPGGRLEFYSAYSTIKAKDNTLEIRGTAENPTLFDYTYSSVSDNVGYYALLEVAIVGDADSAVQFNYTGGTGEALGFQRAFRTTKGFADFLGNLKDPLKDEFLLPVYIGALLAEGKVTVDVLPTHDKWFGVTYKEDRDAVAAALKDLSDKGVYKRPLFSDFA